MALLPNLKHLDLSNNEIVSLSSLSRKSTGEDASSESSVRWPSLIELNLSYNKIVEVNEINCS